MPVTLPPGRARLSTRPASTGSSPAPSKTMGIILVAFIAARTAGSPDTKRISTLSRSSSAASSGGRSDFPSAYRYSMDMFCPSLYPRSLSANRIPSTRADSLAASVFERYPIRETFAGCCASAKEALDSRTAATRQTIIFVFIVSALLLPNHLVRSRQHVGRNRQADLLGRLQVDDELKPHRLLNRQVARRCASENFIHVSCGTPIHLCAIRPIRH